MRVFNFHDKLADEPFLPPVFFCQIFLQRLAFIISLNKY